MAANKTTAQEVKELVVDAHFIMRSYEREEAGKKESVDFLSFELINPFGDEEMFQDIPLKAKWDKYDENRLVRRDRVFDCMGYYAKKALRSEPEILVKVKIKPVTYKSKRSGDMVTYPAMFAEPTFTELAEERPVEVVVKSAKDVNIFNLLAGKALGLSFTAKETDYEDYGLQ